MQLKTFILLIFYVLLQYPMIAHEGGHGYPIMTWKINEIPTVAEFLKYEKDTVILLDTDHELIIHDLTAFSQEAQAWIKSNNEKITAINGVSSSQNSTPIYSRLHWFGFLLGGLLLLSSMFLFITREKGFHLVYGVLGALMIGLMACKSNDDDMEPITVAPTVVPRNDVNFLGSLFGQFAGVQTNSDQEWFYISSNGLPSHDMMVGITNWQQQVPIDQGYTGTNSWAIPIQPELAVSPLSTQTNLLKGAIAIAANGIPIFNPLNNRGEDANAIGELDQWGGHCGRADDYHYHLPPTHLQSILGDGNPIAYALDGFPIYGETTEALDEYLGRFTTDSSYQYHTIDSYPYFMAGMRGKVTLDPNTSAPENQAIPQAMTQELRPATDPLPGAVITDFTTHNQTSHSLIYTLSGESFTINYSWDNNGLYTYEFVAPNGKTRVETYQR